MATQVGVWTYFIYDAFGKLVAEYGGGASTNPNKTVKYIQKDWQGSTRTIIEKSGQIKRIDYTAFGEETNSGVGLRSTSQGFNASNNLNQKYALTERDKATGLDHTWFRRMRTKPDGGQVPIRITEV